MTLYETIKHYCIKKGISFTQLSKLSNVSLSVITDLKNKSKTITLDSAAKIAKALDITIDELYYGNNIEMRYKK